MVSQLSLIFMFCTLFLVFVLPLGAVVYLYKKEHISLKAIGIGALAFVIFQVVARIPLLTFFSGQPWFQALMENLLFSAVVVGGLSAGLFEEVGRYLAFRFPLKKNLSWRNGVAYGLGHGGIEAILLAGTAYINNIITSLMINTGTFERLIGPGKLDAASAEMVKNQLINTPPIYFLLSGLERFFTLFIQVGLSLLVLYGVMKKEIRNLFYAILLHTLVNAPAVILFQQGVSIWLVEFLILLLATLSTVWIIRSRPLFDRLTTANEDGNSKD
jgi:uncharacterized membrane protein YhfC